MQRERNHRHGTTRARISTNVPQLSRSSRELRECCFNQRIIIERSPLCEPSPTPATDSTKKEPILLLLFLYYIKKKKKKSISMYSLRKIQIKKREYIVRIKSIG